MRTSPAEVCPLPSFLTDSVSDSCDLQDSLNVWSMMLAGTYRDAYMSLSAAAVFAPFVRAELLQWDPLYAGPAGVQIFHISPKY